MKTRRIAAAAIACGLVLVPTVARAGTGAGADPSGRSQASPAGGCAILTVHGSVAATTTITNAMLSNASSYPQVTINGVSGVPLEDLLYSPGETPAGATTSPTAPEPGAATLVTPNQAKLPFLAAVLTVTGSDGSPLAVAMGELDAQFGNHPALLTGVGRGNPTLVFPQDRDSSRTVPDVYDINVTAVDPTVLDVPPEAWNTTTSTVQPNTAIVVRKNRGETVEDLWVSQLAALPQVTLQATYNTTTMKVETGPTLGDVLEKLSFHTRRDTAVWATGIPFAPPPVTVPPATGNSTFSTAVTPAEAGPGNRPLLISLNETPVGKGGPSAPRLIPDGDLEGARYNSNFVTLTILDTATKPAPARFGCLGEDAVPGSSAPAPHDAKITGNSPARLDSGTSTEPSRPAHRS